MRLIRPRILVLLVVGLLLVPAGVRAMQADLLQFSKRTIQLSGKLHELRRWDLNADGRGDLLVVHIKQDAAPAERRIAVWFQSSKGFSKTPSQEWLVPSDVTSVGVANLLGGNEREFYYLKPSGVEVLPWNNGEWAEPKPYIEEATFFTRQGENFLPMWRQPEDLDGDGREDLVVPTPDGYAIYLDLKPDGHGEPFRLPVAPVRQVSARNTAFLQITNRLPQLVSTDANGDGRPDLMTVQDENLSVYLQTVKGTYATTPERQVRLAVMRDAVARDFMSFTTLQVRDLNRDKVSDAVVLKTSGSIGVFDSINTRVFIFKGDKNGFLHEVPDQTLKVNGVSIDPVFADLNGDKYDDLIVSSLRTDLWSNIGKALLRVISITYMVFLYDDKADRFSRSPGYEYTVEIDVKKLESGAISVPWVYFRGDLDGDKRVDRVEVSGKDELQVFRGTKVYGGLHKSDVGFTKHTVYDRQLKKNPDEVVLEDLNGDRMTDIILTGKQNLTIYLSKRW